MLQGLRNWLDRTFAKTNPPTVEQTRQAAETARQDRAGSIDDLRLAVRRLQQEIKDVSDTLDGGATGGERAAQERRLAALQRELEQKQRELGGLQARV